MYGLVEKEQQFGNVREVAPSASAECYDEAIFFKEISLNQTAKVSDSYDRKHFQRRYTSQWNCEIVNVCSKNCQDNLIFCKYEQSIHVSYL